MSSFNLIAHFGAKTDKQFTHFLPVICKKLLNRDCLHEVFQFCDLTIQLWLIETCVDCSRFDILSLTSHINSISNKILRQKKYAKLKMIDLFNTIIIPDLSIFTELEEIDALSVNALTDEDIAKCPKLRKLKLFIHDEITDLTPLTELEELDAYWCEPLTNESIAKCTKLRILNIGRNENITDFSPFTKLQELHIYKCTQLTPEILALYPKVKIYPDNPIYDKHPYFWRFLDNSIIIFTKLGT